MAALRRAASSSSRRAASSCGSRAPGSNAARPSVAAWRTGQLSSVTAESSGAMASGRPERASAKTAARRADSSPVRRAAMAPARSVMASLHAEDGDELGEVLGLAGQVVRGLAHLLDGGQVVAGDLGDVLHRLHHQLAAALLLRGGVRDLQI